MGWFLTLERALRGGPKALAGPGWDAVRQWRQQGGSLAVVTLTYDSFLPLADPPICSWQTEHMRPLWWAPARQPWQDRAEWSRERVSGANRRCAPLLCLYNILCFSFRFPYLFLLAVPKLTITETSFPYKLQERIDIFVRISLTKAESRKTYFQNVRNCCSQFLLQQISNLDRVQTTLLLLHCRLSLELYFYYFIILLNFMLFKYII